MDPRHARPLVAFCALAVITGAVAGARVTSETDVVQLRPGPTAPVSTADSLELALSTSPLQPRPVQVADRIQPGGLEGGLIAPLTATTIAAVAGPATSPPQPTEKAKSVAAKAKGSSKGTTKGKTLARPKPTSPVSGLGPVISEPDQGKALGKADRPRRHGGTDRGFVRQRDLYYSGSLQVRSQDVRRPGKHGWKGDRDVRGRGKDHRGRGRDRDNRGQHGHGRGWR